MGAFVEGCDRGRDSWGALFWKLVFPALVFLVGSTLYLPLPHTYPSAGLDPSWRYALNESQALEIAFGRDIIFTIGPYTSLWSHLFHPATFWVVLVAGLALTLAFTRVVCGLSREVAPGARILLLIVLFATGFSPDAPFVVYPLLVLVFLVGNGPAQTRFDTGVAAFPPFAGGRRLAGTRLDRGMARPS